MLLVGALGGLDRREVSVEAVEGRVCEGSSIVNTWTALASADEALVSLDSDSTVPQNAGSARRLAATSR